MRFEPAHLPTERRDTNVQNAVGLGFQVPLVNPSTAQHDVTVIDDDRLSRCNGALGAVEFQPERRIVAGPHAGRSGGVMVSDLCGYRRARLRHSGDPIHVAGGQDPSVECFARSNRDRA